MIGRATHTLVVKLRVNVNVNVKSQTSKLDPEVGSVMGWPTTHHHQATFLGLKLLIKAR